MSGTLEWNALSRDDLEKHCNNRAAWSDLYGQILPALDFTEALLRFELESFESQSGKDRLAFWAVRTKTVDSFADKILAIARESRLSDRFLERGAVTIFDLVNDLVGGRLVFYFERDIQDAVTFWMSFPTYYPVEVTRWVQDVSGYDTAIPAAARWIKYLPGNQARERAAPKVSGYESLHFVLSLDPGLLEARCKVAERRPETVSAPAKAQLVELWKKADTHVRRIVSAIKFEIQCRTILEHTWAEVEHRARYSIAKARRRVANISDDQIRTFRNYKAILRAAQVFQNSIKYGFTRWDEGDAALAGRSTSIEIGDRAQYWSPEHQATLQTLNEALRKALVAARQDNSPTEDPWEVAYVEFVKTIARLGYEGQVSITPELPFEEYCRRRLLVMLLGFILAYATRGDGYSDQEHERGKSIRDRAAEMYYQQNLPEAARHWVSPAVAAVRVYEHLKLLDAFYSEDSPQAVCFDPLVEARAASVYFRHFGALRRSSALLEEALVRVPRWNAPAKQTALMLSPKYLRHRLAENHWAAYNLEGRSEADIRKALQEARRTLAENGPEGEEYITIVRQLDQKAVAHILTMTLYAAISGLRQGGEDLTGELRWRALDVVLAETRDVGTDSVASLDDANELADSSLRLQGHAIAVACRAAREAERRNCDALLVEARRAARKARRNIAHKNEKRRGGALPFHVEVAREMEDFVFSLCSDDRTLNAVDDVPTR